MPNVLLLLAFFRLQIKLEPYKLSRNNKLERKEFIAGLLTMFGGTLFVDQKNKVELINLIVFVLVVAINMHFILYWIY